MNRFGADRELSPGTLSGDRRSVGSAMRCYAIPCYAMRVALACALLSAVTSCSKGAATSSAPPSISAPATISATSPSSERDVAHPASDQKTVVSRLDSAPAVAPVKSGPSVPGPGATPSPGDSELLAEAAETEKSQGLRPGAKEGKNPTVKNFEAFWKPFRKALLDSDMAAVANVTMFPFRVLSDGEPTRNVDPAEFPSLVRRLLAQDTGLHVGGHEPHLQLVKRLPRILPDFVQGPTARIGDLQFWFNPEGWRFESAWLSEIDESK
jgi:hypothetical protein